MMTGGDAKMGTGGDAKIGTGGDAKIGTVPVMSWHDRNRPHNTSNPCSS